MVSILRDSSTLHCFFSSTASLLKRLQELGLILYEDYSLVRSSTSLTRHRFGLAQVEPAPTTFANRLYSAHLQPQRGASQQHLFHQVCEFAFACVFLSSVHSRRVCFQAALKLVISEKGEEKWDIYLN